MLKVKNKLIYTASGCIDSRDGVNMVSFNPAITERLNALSGTVLNGHYIFSRDFDDAYLARRFSQPDKYAHNISYGPVYDRLLIEQYYNIRQEAYKQLHHDKNFVVPEDDEHDINSVIYMAKAGNSCVGGIRLTISTPQQPVKLALESDEFAIQDYFPNLDLSKITYCEASRLAILPDYRNGFLWNQLHHKSTDFLVKEMGVEIGFGQSQALQTRRFRAQFRDMGYKMIVRNDLKTGVARKFPDLNIKFWAIDFTSDQRYAEKLRALVSEPVGDQELEIA